jgi:glycosyltransferase involved in cell wall biosynthesis
MTEKTQLLMVLPGSFETAGGIGRQVGYLLEAFRATDAPIEVQILNSRGSGPVWLSPFYLAGACCRVLSWRFRREKPVLHVNLASRASTARKFFLVLSGRAAGLPVLIHLHGAQFHMFYMNLHVSLQKAVQYMFSRSQQVVVLGDVWRDFLVMQVGVAPEKIVILHNAVPEPRRGSTPDPEAYPVRILFLGRLGERKGVGDLLHALASPLVRDLPWQAEIAGDGDIETFRTLAAALGLAGQVQFPGWVGQADVSAKLAAADLFVLPSYNENLPIAVLEALAHGVPVISTPVGAIPEVVTNGQEGCLVPPGDRMRLAACLADLIQNGEKRVAMSIHARKTFARAFDIRVCSAKFINVYQRLSKKFIDK